VTDSKKITTEEGREEVYGRIMGSVGVRWAVAVVDAGRIDKVNILEATMETMRMAVASIVEVPEMGEGKGEGTGKVGDTGGVIRREESASSTLTGCYVICGKNDSEGTPIDPSTTIKKQQYHALIDGNRTPKQMPCPSEAMIKGDSREYSIAAASVLAKVTRDRLMHEYDKLYPAYDLGKHKGYPTAKHRAKVREVGASPIHRRTFAPLKSMVFDEDGGVLEDRN